MMTPADLRRQLWQAATQYGADAWDAEHARLRPDVIERIRQERDCERYRAALAALRAKLKNGQDNVSGQ